KLARQADPLRRLGRQVVAGVEGLDLHVRDGREAELPLALGAVTALEPFALHHRRTPRRSGTTRGAARGSRRRSTSFRATGSQSSGTSTWTRAPKAADGYMLGPSLRSRTGTPRCSRNPFTTCACGDGAE